MDRLSKKKDIAKIHSKMSAILLAFPLDWIEMSLKFPSGIQTICPYLS